LTEDRPARRSHGHWRVGVGLIGVLILRLAPGSVLAQNAQIRLALVPVGQPGSFFDLTMEPGDTRTLAVDIANYGGAALAARTYAADVYTIVDGGFGARLRGEPATGTTRWLAYPTSVLQLSAGAATRRSFTVSVPAGSGPGEYIASLVLENDRPITDGGAVALDQIVRQAVAVVVTVPGRRSPALGVGQASHLVVAGTSVVSVAVANTGNVRLKPIVGFTLLDATGRHVSQASVPMGTFYAHAATTVEMSLAALLLPGTYTVRVTLDDATSGAAAEATIPLIVAAAVVSPRAGGGVIPALAQVDQAGPNNDSPPVSVAILVAALALSSLILVVGLLTVRRRRAHHRGITAG
jgi:hypothetical protein